MKADLAARFIVHSARKFIREQSETYTASQSAAKLSDSDQIIKSASSNLDVGAYQSFFPRDVGRADTLPQNAIKRRFCRRRRRASRLG